MAIFIYFHLTPQTKYDFQICYKASEKTGNVNQTLIKSLILLIKISGQTLSDSRDQI